MRTIKGQTGKQTKIISSGDKGGEPGEAELQEGESDQQCRVQWRSPVGNG